MWNYFSFTIYGMDPPYGPMKLRNKVNKENITASSHTDLHVRCDKIKRAIIEAFMECACVWS